MNRLRLPEAKAGKRASELIKGRLVITDAVNAENAAASELALFGPLHYEPGYAYPLIVWLHGAGDDELQLQRAIPLVSARNFVAVAPRGTEQHAPAGQARYDWPRGRNKAAMVQERVAGVIVAAKQRYHINASRVFVAGFDTGGTMALRLAMERPENFAGAISLGGPFPTEDAPLARLENARRVPLLIACGRDSQRYAPAQVCSDLRLLHAAGMDVTLRQYSGGHQLGPQMLADVNRWIMERLGAR